jgi:hypothetical protein
MSVMILMKHILTGKTSNFIVHYVSWAVGSHSAGLQKSDLFMELEFSSSC